MKLLSWNVNGLRAAYKKGFIDWVLKEQPDILCIQETKASVNQIPDDLKKIKSYQSYFVSADKKGYSGVGLFTKESPVKIQEGIKNIKFDSEGRIIIAEFQTFMLFNVYFPNGKASKERLKYKLDFYNSFLKYVNKLKNEGKKIVICGDVNTAHKEIDLSRPKENEAVSGFLPKERAWIDKFLSNGYLDSFRLFYSNGGHYSWWDYKTKARERNVGWRIDYFFISNNLKQNIASAYILKDVMGSDHCPIGIKLKNL